jgi:hypothetical protein
MYVYIQINICLSPICFRHPFANTEGKFNMSKAMMGKYDLIERKEMDDALKQLCYKMIKMVKSIIYICV